jgi:putative transcriptional regulator
MPAEAAPVLLLSMPQMADPNFSRTVILLCDYTDQGAFGVVVNRPMTEPAWTLIKTDPPIRVDPEIRLWIGGPVEPQRTWVLMSDAQGPEEEQREVAPGVLLSVSHELTLRTLQEAPTSRTRVIAGYAGWGPGQLDKEIKRH